MCAVEKNAQKAVALAEWNLTHKYDPVFFFSGNKVRCCVLRQIRERVMFGIFPLRTMTAHVPCVPSPPARNCRNHSVAAIYKK